MKNRLGRQSRNGHRSCAPHRARDGAKVTAWDVSAEKLESFVNQVKAMGQQTSSAEWTSRMHQP